MARGSIQEADFKTHNVAKFHIKPTSVLVLLLSVFSCLYYISFLFTPSNISYWPLYIVLLIADVYAIVHIVIPAVTIIMGAKEVRDLHYYQAQQKLLDGEINATVDIFITCCGEDNDVITETIKTAKAIELPHIVHILDDGQNDDLKAIAKKLKVDYIRREDRKDFKAGNVNNALEQTNGEYVAIFDADYTINDQFLVKTLPFFYDEKVAFVQTPQHYKNETSLIARGASLAQNVFYKYICPGKNAFNSVFFVGTNAIFRRKKLEEIGGIHRASCCEDVWTAYKLHLLGYKSVFLEEVLASGLAPENHVAYLKQQMRWSTGSFELFFMKNPLLTNLSLDQKIQYLDTTLHYFTGFALLVGIFMPTMYLFFGVQPLQASGGFVDWLIHYVPFIVLQYAVVFDMIGKGFFDAIVVTINSYWTYITAFFKVILGQTEGWTVTNAKIKKKISSSDYLVYHIITVIILSAAILVGLFSYRDIVGSLGSIIWTSFYLIVFIKFITFSLKNYKQ